ncbi:MAG: VCBS repeat-containing protein [Candidatus Thorarchaeota archaeon]|nr:VCBS repeat-containing protein [Candidatus Thorarchaeota archaeon]
MLNKKNFLIVSSVLFVLFFSQLLVAGFIMNTEEIKNENSTLERNGVYTLAYETSGVEIVFGGDFAYHEISAWENFNDWWEENYSIEVHDPGWGFVRDVIVEDIDGDGEHETIIANSGSTIHIFEHNGTDLVEAYNMTHPAWSNAQVVTLAVGDLDNDEDSNLEILAGTFDFNFQSVIFKKVGDSYHPIFNISSSDSRNVGGPACCVGDLDNNGDLEFIVTEELPNVDGVSELRLFDWQTDHWANIRNYSFAKGAFHNMVRHIQIADVDNDGASEVLVVHDQEWVHILEYSGGYFSKSWSCPLLTENVESAIAGDITNDGLIDIVIPDSATDVVYIYETVEGSIMNTFNVSLAHTSTRWNCMDIDDLNADEQNEWVCVYWNETAFPYMWVSVFKNNTLLLQKSTGFLEASAVEIGNYDNDDAGTISTTTPTTSSSGGFSIPMEILAIVIIAPIALIPIAIVVRRQHR